VNRVLVVFSDELLAQVDAARGLASRSAWIRSWCEHGIRVENEWPAVEAVAPLVPADYVYDEISIGGGVKESRLDMRKIGGLSPNAFDSYKAEPKPKARRKKMKELESETLKAMESVEKIISPQRCNRGACTGTINPVKGRCVRCNQTPLKESK
jgi:hypothetical protein